MTRDAERPDPFLGTSERVRQLARRAGVVAASDRSALLLAETGCGKGVLARWLHDHGPRAAEPFVELNCAGLKPEFLESELFGHAKGAFTGAVEAKEGLLSVADRGTLLLDEIGEMDLTVQAKLLKVLEEKTFRRLGEVRERRVDVRLLAATHRSLPERVREGSFRSDLYFRLNTLHLKIPPLRQRWKDVRIFAEHFVERLRHELDRPDLTLSPEALETLMGYPWLGNVRELRNVLESAVLFKEGDVLEPQDFELDAGDDLSATSTLDLSLQDLEARHIRRVLESEKGSMTKAAQKLGIQRNTLYSKIRKYSLERPDA